MDGSGASGVEPTPTDRTTDRRVLLAVAATFAANAGVYGSLLPRFPQLADRLEAGEAAFGLALLGGGLGGLVGSTLMPAVVRRAGGFVPTIRVAVPVMLLGGVAVGAAPSLWVFGLAMLVMGLADGVLDPAMNELALGEQHRHGRSIMGRMHATWSGTTTAAVAVGTGMAAADVPVALHVGIVAAAMGLLQLTVGRALRERHGAPPAADRPDAGPGDRASLREGVWVRRGPLLTLGAVGVMGVAAAWIEVPPQDWSALLLSRELGASPGLAGAGPLVFVGGVFLGRTAMDRLVDRFGGRRVAIGAGLASLVGVSLGLLATSTTGSPWPLLVGLLLGGLGASPVFPLMFTAGDAAARQLGRPAGTGGSFVSAASRLGFLSSPVLVGLVAERLDLVVALAITPLGALLMLATLPRMLRGAEA
ncbi:hypothetical protein [Euzebya rosea]|uniref:hypothetical protein n=1 Tax=Euzebya rosea TaxID=2052804 RepID=UPI000D3E8D23|nr:hypothetical protein [Euzebya rosea]